MNKDNQPRFGFVNFAEIWNYNYWTKYSSTNWNRLVFYLISSASTSMVLSLGFLSS